MSTSTMSSRTGSDPFSETLGAGLTEAGPDDPGGNPAIVRGTCPPTGAGPVLVAVDDDDNAGALLRYGCRLAARLGVSLRVAYVWSDCRPPDCTHHRRCHRYLAEAGRVLSELLDEHLAIDEARQVEWDVLHEDDPATALVALSASASMLVVGSSSDRPPSPAALSATTRAILGRTRCPVVVVPYRGLSATRATW